MRNLFVRNPKRTLIKGIISIALGAVCLAMPGLTIDLFIRSIGIALIIFGATSLIISNKKKKNDLSSLIVASQGGITLIFGLILAAFPSTFMSIIVWLIAVTLIIIGFTQLLSIFSARKAMKFSWIFFLLSLGALMAGLFMLSEPFRAAEYTLQFIGGVMVIYGIGIIIWSERLKKYDSNNNPQAPENKTKITDGDYVDFEEVD